VLRGVFGLEEETGDMYIYIHKSFKISTLPTFYPLIGFVNKLKVREYS
jgi:hypothetical protein